MVGKPQGSGDDAVEQQSKEQIDADDGRWSMVAPSARAQRGIGTRAKVHRRRRARRPTSATERKATSLY